MNKAEPFYTAVSVCAPILRTALMAADEKCKEETFEIRLRAGTPVVLVGTYGSRFLMPSGGVTGCAGEGLFVSSAALNDTFNRLCGYSIHSHQSSIVNGYITMRGGHRAGIAGSAVTGGEGQVQSIRNVSSLNIRIAREWHGAADRLLHEVFSDGLKSVIIAGPPSSGKTTLLRDTARQLSAVGEKSCKVTVIDEREELAGVCDGVCRFDVGMNTDVLDSYPKPQAVSLAIRTLSPDVIVCDEVSEESELRAIEAGANAGVRFVLSVHASDYREVLRRRQIERLLMTYGFEKLVLLRVGEVCAIEAIYDAGEILDEICRDRLGGTVRDDDGLFPLGACADKTVYG